MHATPRAAVGRTVFRFGVFQGLMAAGLASAAMAGGGKTPPNDECENAIAIDAGDVAFTGVGVTSSGPELPESCNHASVSSLRRTSGSR